MPRPRHTRRQALALGAAALALAGVRSRREAVAAAAGPDTFELPVPDAGARAAAGGRRTTDVLRAPRRFHLAGVRWARGGDVEVELRARRRGGRWTRWVALPGAGDHGPDAGGAHAGTEPAWTGPADELQLRLRGDARALRVRCVQAPRGPRRTARAARAAAPRRGRVQAPRIITRAEWGGDAVPPRSAPAFGQVQLAFVHHTVTAADYGPEDSAAMVVAITRYHRDGNGWNDVGYNFLVDRYGQVFEGRAGGVDQAIVGAQAQGWNTVSTGIACLGTFTERGADRGGAGRARAPHRLEAERPRGARPRPGERRLLRRRVQPLPGGTPVVFERISGHRDGNATACPGEALYAQLPEVRARAAAYAGPVAGLTLRSSTSTVRGLAPVLLSGWLRFADGAPPAGAPVEILQVTGGAAVRRLAATACAGDGGWSATVTLTRTGTVFARFPGDGVHAAADSPRMTVTILPRLALRLSRAQVRRGRQVRASGTVTPPGARRGRARRRAAGARALAAPGAPPDPGGGGPLRRDRPARPPRAAPDHGERAGRDGLAHRAGDLSPTSRRAAAARGATPAACRPRRPRGRRPCPSPPRRP